MNTRGHRALLLATTACALLGLAEMAAAQTAAEPVMLDDIVVTAQRRAENLQQTPLAVTAVTAEELERTNIQTTQDLMQVTPSLQVSTQLAGNGGGSATFTVRGVGQVRAGNGSEPAVGIYIDNFYYPSLQGSVFSILDIERVEVLRGPQGTLFGRNTIGGAIRYVTKAPEFGDTFGYVQGALGSNERQDVQGSLNVGFDKAAVRVTGGRLRTDGYVRQQNGQPDAGATETDLIRGQLRLQPIESLDINLAAQYSRSLLDGFTYFVPRPFTITPFSSGAYRWNNSPAGRANPYDDRYASVCDYCQPGTGYREFSETKFRSFNGTVKWDLNDQLTLTSLTGWQEVRNQTVIDQDRTPIPLGDSPGASRQRAFSQELQLNAALFDERLNLVAGAYYLDQQENTFPGRAGPRLSNGVRTPFVLAELKTTTKAAFLDGTYKLNDQISLLAGIRYSTDHRSGETSSEAGALLTSDEGDFPATTWRFGGQVQWTPQIMTYATVSRGFRAGGFSQLSIETPLVQPFKPEYGTNYEIGARMDLFGRLRLNPTVFYTEWEDIQIQRVTPNPAGGAPFIYLINAGDAHASGLELEAEFAVTEDLQLFGSLALLDMQYDRIAPGVTEVNLGSHFMRAPELMYNVGARYRTTINEFGVAATANYSWQDEQYSSATLPDGLLLPSYGIVGARIEITDPSERFTLSVYGTNLTDEVYYIGGAWLTPVGTRAYDLGRPREYGASLRFKF